MSILKYFCPMNNSFQLLCNWTRQVNFELFRSNLAKQNQLLRIQILILRSHHADESLSQSSDLDFESSKSQKRNQSSFKKVSTLKSVPASTVPTSTDNST